MGRPQRPAPQAVLQHDRPSLQKSGPEGQAADHDRGRADRPAGVGRYARQAPAAGGRRFCPARL